MQTYNNSEDPTSETTNHLSLSCPYMNTSPWSLGEWDDGSVSSGQNPGNTEVPLPLGSYSEPACCASHRLFDPSTTGLQVTNINPVPFQSRSIHPSVSFQRNVNWDHETGRYPCASCCNGNNSHLQVLPLPPPTGLMHDVHARGNMYRGYNNNQQLAMGGVRHGGLYQYSQDATTVGTPFAGGLRGMQDRQHEGGLSPSSAAGTNADWDIPEWNALFDSPGGSGGSANNVDRATLEGMCERGGAFLVCILPLPPPVVFPFKLLPAIAGDGWYCA